MSLVSELFASESWRAPGLAAILRSPGKRAKSAIRGKAMNANFGRSASVSGLQVALGICAALMTIGVFGPWLRYYFQTYNGVEGGGVLALAFVAMAIVGVSVGTIQRPAPRWTAIVSLLGFLLAVVWGAIIFLILLNEARGELDSFGFTGITILWGFWVYAAAALVGMILSIVNAVRGSGNASLGSFLQAPAPVVIHNHSESSAHVSNAGAPRETLSQRGARIGVIDRGHTLPDVAARPGQPLVVGRDSAATVMLSDPKASRRHVEILLEGTTWVVRDLGAMNPTRLLASNGAEQAIGHSTRRLEHGQLAVGDSIITLYPVGR